MSQIDSKLCIICLNSKTRSPLLSELNNPYLNKFFVHVLGIHESPLRIWLCGWCTAILKKIMGLVRLTEESNSYLSHVKLNKEELRAGNFSLSFHHNEHTDIPPFHTKNARKIIKKNKLNKKSNKQIKEIPEVDIERKVKEENVESENEIEEFKVEVVDMDMSDGIDDRDEIDDKKNEIGDQNVEIGDKNVEIGDKKVEIGDKKVQEKDDTNETVGIDILGRPIKKMNPKLYAKCERDNFTLKILTIEEQKAEWEERKKSGQYLKRKYKCDSCGVGFVTQDAYNEHMERHKESHSNHECPLCHVRFSTSLVLSQHCLAHARRFTCRLCGATAARYSECDVHRRQCPRPTPGVCQHCNKIYTNQNSLDSHIRNVHYKKEKKFVCSYCNQKFQTKQRLAIHTRTHTGLKPYVCDICHRSFAANANLRSHLSSHARSRPHYCVECDKSYKTRKGLRRHLLEGAPHAGRNTHSCHHCLKSFSSEKLLAAHISSAHEKDPDSCQLCQKTFSSSASLKKHIRTVHEASNV